MKIIDKQDRSILGEGRNTGMAFGFCKEVKKGKEYETVMPPSPCKDFLNEPLFTENTGLKTSMYGLTCEKPLGIFKDAVYIAIRMVGETNKDTSGYYFGKNLQEDRKLVAGNIQNMEYFMNWIENAIGIKERTEIHEANDNFFLVVAPLDWRKSTYAMSLYTLLLRASIFYKDRAVDPVKFCETYSYNAADEGMVKPATNKLKHFIEKKFLPDQPEEHIKSCKSHSWQPHNHGILSYQILP